MSDSSADAIVAQHDAATLRADLETTRVALAATREDLIKAMCEREEALTVNREMGKERADLALRVLHHYKVRDARIAALEVALRPFAKNIQSYGYPWCRDRATKQDYEGALFALENTSPPPGGEAGQHGAVSATATLPGGSGADQTLGATQERVADWVLSTFGEQHQTRAAVKWQEMSKALARAQKVVEATRTFAVAGTTRVRDLLAALHEHDSSSPAMDPAGSAQADLAASTATERTPAGSTPGDGGSVSLERYNALADAYNELEADRDHLRRGLHAVQEEADERKAEWVHETCQQVDETYLLRLGPAEESVAVLSFSDTGHDGPGWYYWDEEYPEEGACGAFATRKEAEAHARDGDYNSFRLDPKSAVPVENEVTLGQRIRKLRGDGYTALGLANTAGLSLLRFAEIEFDLRAPTKSELAAIAAVLRAPDLFESYAFPES